MAGTAPPNERNAPSLPLGEGFGEGIHILVVRLSAMGDVAMTVPVLLALRKKYPHIKITLLTKPQFGPIFSSINGITLFFADVNSKHKGIGGLWKLCGELGRSSITHVADLHNVLRSKIIGFFFAVKGIPVLKMDKGRAEKGALTRPRNKKFSPLRSSVERYLDVFNDMGLQLDFREKHFLPRPVVPQGTLDLGDPKTMACVGIAPFAAYESKMYRLDLMEEVIQKLISLTNCRVLLFGGGQKEEEQLLSLESKFKGKVRSMAGKVSFKEELALISNLDVMLAMDSGNGHLAANYGVPVVTLWGVTHPYAGFAPYDQPLGNSMIPDRITFPLIPTSVYGNTYPEKYLEAINSISPDAIVEKVLDVLDGQMPYIP